MKFKYILILIIIICINLFSVENNGIIIFFTNDTNGHPLSFNDMGQDGQGGIPARSALIKKIIRDKKIGFNNYLILDAGGIIRGRPESNLFNGFPDIFGMDSAGYFASGVGTSELYYGAKYFNNLNSKSRFYFLSSNIKAINEKNPEITDKFIIKKIGNIKIGIFSVITTDALKEISEQARKDFSISNPIDTAKQIVTELKSEKNNVDIIIALTQLGYYPEDSNVGSRNLASMVDGIDLIIDGRTGVKLEEPAVVNNTKIFQAYKWGLFLGEIDLKFSDKKIEDVNYNLYPVNVKNNNGNFIQEKIDEDKIVLAIIKSKMINYDNIISREIGKIEKGVKFDAKDSNSRETEIGNFICDALIDYTKADIAFQNSGGIGSAVLEGSINRKSFNNIIKYDNSIIICSIKGSDIIRILEYSMKRIGSPGFLQVGGVKFDYSKSQNKIIKIEINGNQVENNKFYNVAINSWLADGMDGYEIFKDIPDKINLNILHREAVYSYIEKIKNIKLVLDSRINIVN